MIICFPWKKKTNKTYSFSTICIFLVLLHKSCYKKQLYSYISNTEYSKLFSKTVQINNLSKISKLIYANSSPPKRGRHPTNRKTHFQIFETRFLFFNLPCVLDVIERPNNMLVGFSRVWARAGGITTTPFYYYADTPHLKGLPSLHGAKYAKSKQTRQI